MSRVAASVFVHAALAGLCLLSLGPLLWMLAVSFMPAGQASSFPPPLWPSPITFDNYRELFARAGMGRSFVNSALLAVLSTFDEGSDLVLYYKQLMVLEGNPEYELN